MPFYPLFPNPSTAPVEPDGDYQVRPSDQFINFDTDADCTLQDAEDVIGSGAVFITSTNGTVTVLADVTINGISSIPTDVTVGFYLARNTWWRI